MRDPEFPSDEEMAVIYWASLVIAVLVGIGCFYYAAKADGPESALALRIAGALSLVVAVLIVVISKIVSMFLD